MTGSAALVLAVLTVGGAVLAFLAMNWALDRASQTGSYGVALGSGLGIRTRRGDPFGVVGRLPALGVERRPVSTGTFGQLGLVAVVEESSPASSTTAFYLWIRAGMDADVVRRPDGATERTHATRGGLADRLVKGIATSVPQATVVWATAGSAPPASREPFDRASAPVRPVGLAGDGPVGAVGLALRADLVTNPVAWLRWLREVVYAEQDGGDPPPPPSVGFG